MYFFPFSQIMNDVMRKNSLLFSEQNQPNECDNDEHEHGFANGNGYCQRYLPLSNLICSFWQMAVFNISKNIRSNAMYNESKSKKPPANCVSIRFFVSFMSPISCNDFNITLQLQSISICCRCYQMLLLLKLLTEFLRVFVFIYDQIPYPILRLRQKVPCGEASI